MEKRIRNKNSPTIVVEKKIFHVRYHQTMCILGIPDVGVLEMVHVDVQAVRVHVHVGDKMYDMSSIPLQDHVSQ